MLPLPNIPSQPKKGKEEARMSDPPIKTFDLEEHFDNSRREFLRKLADLKQEANAREAVEIHISTLREGAMHARSETPTDKLESLLAQEKRELQKILNQQLQSQSKKTWVKRNKCISGGMLLVMIICIIVVNMYVIKKLEIETTDSSYNTNPKNTLDPMHYLPIYHNHIMDIACNAVHCDLTDLELRDLALRSNLSLTPQEATIEFPYIVVHDTVIDYSLNVSQMVRAGKYRVASPFITTEYFPIDGKGLVEIRLYLLYFNQFATSAQVLAEFDKRNLRSATVEELLSIVPGADERCKAPRFCSQDIYAKLLAFPSPTRTTIIALDSSFVDGIGNRFIPYIYYDNGEPSLDLISDRILWNGLGRFLAVHK